MANSIYSVKTVEVVDIMSKILDFGAHAGTNVSLFSPTLCHKLLNVHILGTF